MLLGNPGILGQGYAHYYSIAIPGCTWEGLVLLGNPGILGQGVCPCITL